jgi:hypothetical protein
MASTPCSWRSIGSSVEHVFYIREYTSFAFSIALFVFRENMKSFSPRSVGQRTSWKERFFLVGSALAAVVIGFGALHTLEAVEIMKLKTLECGVVIVPTQVLSGLRLASKVQRMREQRVLAGLTA